MTSKATDAVVVIAICFGWFIVASIGAVVSGFPTRPFDDSAFGGIILFEVVLATVALGYLRWRGHNLSPLIPVPTGMGSLVGLGLYILIVFAGWPLGAFFGRADLAAQPIEQMIAGASFSLPWLVAASIVNGLYEETFLVGYLLRELETFGASLAIGTTVLVRVLYHLYQGPLGAVYVVVVGAVFGIFYWRTRKLWPVVFAHMFADLAGFALR